MKKFLVFLLLPFCLSGQNLVPNPSFEDTVTLKGFSNCPYFYSYVDYDAVRIAKGWSSYSGLGPTPDYFNSCDGGIVSVPLNYVGYQNAATGNAYCGIFTYSRTNFRELIGAQLKSPLLVGKKYYFSMKVSLADYSDCSSNNIGFLLSTISYKDSANAPINNRATFSFDKIVTDTTDWTIISGTFTADSSYQFIIIGNFFNDDKTDTICSTGAVIGSAYYYLDDICVSLDSLLCDFNTAGITNLLPNEIEVYPNPANTKIFLNGLQSDNVCGSLINLFGQSVIEFKQELTIDISNIPNGIYILKVNYKNGTIQEKQIIIH